MGHNDIVLPEDSAVLKGSAQELWKIPPDPSRREGVNYISQTTGRSLQLGEAQSYSETVGDIPHSLTTNQFKGNTLLPITLYLMATALRTV